MKKIKILILEPCEDLYYAWQRLIDGSARGQFELICTPSPKTAARFFRRYGHTIAGIAVDACWPRIGDTIGSLPFVDKVRESFGGPIIAISAHPSFQKELTRLGRCNYSCKKHELPKKIIEVTKLTRAA